MTVEPNANMTDDGPAKSKSALGRLIPLAIIGAALAAFFGFGLNEYFTLDTLREHEGTMRSFVADNFILSIIGFSALYMILVAIFFPGASILTITGGFLFGTWVGGAAVVIGASLGAIINYVVARWMFRDLMQEKAGAAIKKMEAGFQEDELSYMFILRLVPAFPFFIVNVVPGLIGVKFRNFAIATVLGVMPGTFVYAGIGNGLGAAFAKGEDANLGGALLQPAVLYPIIGLVLLALIPVVYKRFFAKNKQ